MWSLAYVVTSKLHNPGCAVNMPQGFGFACVCGCVTANLPPQGIYKVEKERYYRRQCYVCIVLNGAFFLNCFVANIERFLLTAEKSAIFVCQRVRTYYAILMRACICFYACCSNMYIHTLAEGSTL